MNYAMSLRNSYTVANRDTTEACHHDTVVTARISGRPRLFAILTVDIFFIEVISYAIIKIPLYTHPRQCHFS
jgi:hypothetical protein